MGAADDDNDGDNDDGDDDDGDNNDEGGDNDDGDGDDYDNDDNAAGPSIAKKLLLLFPLSFTFFMSLFVFSNFYLLKSLVIAFLLDLDATENHISMQKISCQAS